MPPAPAPPHQLGCNTEYFYYCTNASDVLSVAAEGGKAAAVRFWLEKMETNLDMPSRNQGSMRVDLTPLGGPFDATIRQAIAFHARVVERFVNQSSLFPPSIVPPRTPVLYPFSGMDVLTATHFFPHASSYTLLANLELGRRVVDPLDCFADYECVRMASRSAYKQAAKQAASPPASSPSPLLPRWVTVGSGMLRCTFICTTIGQENAAILNNILRSAGRGRAAIATTAPPPRRDVVSSGYVAIDHDGSSTSSLEPSAAEDGLDELLYVTLIKAAPAELTTTRWFGEWILPRSVAILQDETGLPVRSLRHATASPRTSLHLSLYPSTNGGLPFPFGYGAYADECRLVVQKLAWERTGALTSAPCCAPFGGKPRPELLRHAVALLGTNDTHAMTRACHGVLFASWRVTGEQLPRATTPMLEGRLG
eukprot:jgi/Chrpa1/17470/Chrysochromulina_OHIO_Genome00023305-RA